MLSVVAAGVLWLTGAGAYAIWWATNTTPPAVTLDVPPNVVRGNVTIGVRLDSDGRSEPCLRAIC